MAELVPVEPFDIVVFGATGDLALRKLVPALFHRWCDGQIPAESRIVAASREDMPTEKYWDLAATHVLSEDSSDNRRARWKEFLAHVTYVAVDATGAGEGWPQLARALDDAENKIRLFYLALPPSLYGPVCKAIGAHKLNTPNARIVLEDRKSVV